MVFFNVRLPGVHLTYETRLSIGHFNPLINPLNQANICKLDIKGIEYGVIKAKYLKVKIKAIKLIFDHEIAPVSLCTAI